MEIDEDYPDLSPPIFYGKASLPHDDFLERCNKKFHQATHLVYSQEPEGLFYEKLSHVFRSLFAVDQCIQKFTEEISCPYLEGADIFPLSISQQQMKNAINAYFEKMDYDEHQKLIKEAISAFDAVAERNQVLIQAFKSLRKALKCQKKFEKSLFTFVKEYQRKTKETSEEFTKEIFPVCKKEILKHLNDYREKAELKDKYRGHYFKIAAVLFERKEVDAALFAMKISGGSSCQSLSLAFNKSLLEQEI